MEFGNLGYEGTFGFRVTGLVFKSWFYSSFSPIALGKLITLSRNFLVCKMGIIDSTSQDYGDSVSVCVKVLAHSLASGSTQ